MWIFISGVKEYLFLKLKPLRLFSPVLGLAPVSPRIPHLFAFVVLTAASLFIRYGVDRVPIDDAYITFRHSLRLFQGQGWGYNDEGTVIATSTPLWAMILAPFSQNLPEAARHLGVMLDSAVPFILYFTFYGLSGNFILSSIVGLLYILSPDAALCAPSGMEIPLFNLSLCFTVLCLQRGWFKSATLCAALLPLIRLEGLLFMVLTWPFYFQTRRFPLHIIVQLLPIVIWCYFKSTLGEGGLLPSSLSGKLAAFSHTGGPSMRVVYEMVDYWASLYFKVLDQNHFANLPRAILWLGIVAAGVLVCLKQFSPVLLLPLFSILYTVGCLLVPVPIYSWYYAISSPGISMGMGAALFMGPKALPVGGAVKRFLPRLGAVFAILMALGGLRALHEFNQDRAPAWLGRILVPNERERANLECVQLLRKNLEEKPLEGKPRILLHDLGLVGFYFPEATMIDSAGIASREVSNFYRNNPQVAGFYLSEELIDFVAPDFFVCAARHGPLGEIWDSVQLKYDEVGRATSETWANPYIVVCRRHLERE